MSKQNPHLKKNLFLGLCILAVTAIGCLSYNHFNLKQSLSFIKAIGENGEDEAKESKNKLAFIEAQWRQEFERTKDPETGKVPTNRLFDALKVKEERLVAMKNNGTASRGINGINWIERGPTNIGGRTRALLFDKNDPTLKTVFAGAIGGGLWRCNDITATAPTWIKISDTYENIAISSIVQSQSNPQIMYFGTGEGWFNLGAQNGLGIWKSTDGGNTWNHLPSTINTDFTTVQRMAIAANNDLYAATAPAGVMKSTDGGKTWKNVLKGSAADLQFAANGDLYASLGIFSPGSVWKSPRGVNGGELGSFINITPTPTAPNLGFQRITIAPAPSDSNTVYVLCQDGAGVDATNMFLSVNAGATWTTCNVSTAVVQDPVPSANVNFTRGQAWYDLVCVVDPLTRTTVYIGGVDVHKSVDAGQNFTPLTKWVSLVNPSPGIPVVHADQHALVFKPGSSDNALFGNDGGVFYGSDLTTATYTIPSKDNGYNVTQFYCVAMHPTLGSNYFLAGAQDNGSQKFDGTTGGGATATTPASGGDGGFCHIDQVNPLNQFTSYVYSSYYQTKNGGATAFANTISDATHGQFINPTDYDPASQVFYGDYTVVATRVGGAYSRWLTTGATNVGVTVTSFNGASVSNVYVSPNVAKRVYFGLANGSIVYVDNADLAVSGVAGTLIKTGIGSVSGIAVEKNNDNHILATYSNYGVQSVWETIDGGTTWTSLEGNLPDMPVRWVIFNPNTPTQALISTEIGVWSTDLLNGSNTEWNPTGNNMPNCRVDMLKVRASDNTIAAATYGRGLFTTTLTNTNTVPQVNFAKQSAFCSEKNPTVLLGCGTYGYKDIAVPIYISKAPVGDAIVDININPNSTAVLDQDYSLPVRTVTFKSGTSTSQIIYVRVYNNYNAIPIVYVELTMSVRSGTDAVKATVNQNFTLQINQDELAPSDAMIAKVQVGNFDTNLGGSSPLQGSQTNKKMQYLYPASELLASGIKPGAIKGFTFSVGTKGSTAPFMGFTIKMGQTTNTALVPGPFLPTTGFSTVYSAPAAGFSSVGGDNEFNFATAFTWDGTSSIVFEYCYSNTAAAPAPPVPLPIGTGDDVLRGQSTSYISQARAASANMPTDNGCAFLATTQTTSNTFRPLIKLYQQKLQTPVETVLNTQFNYHLGPNGTVYFYNGDTVIARVINLSSFDYGCINLKIDRAGTGAKVFNNATAKYFLTSKSLLFTPQNDNPSGALNISVYYTNAEKAGWEAVTGNTWSSASIIKVKGHQISDVTPVTPYTSSIAYSANTTFGTLGLDYLISGNFSTGFSGVAVGVPSVTVLALQNVVLTGNYVGANSLLKWNVATDYTLQNIALQRSFNSIDYSDINSTGFVPSGNYSYVDATTQSKVYYRIKFVTAAGTTQYSNVVVLNRNNISNITVSPSPFTNYMFVQFNNPTSQQLTVELFDVLGNKIYTQQNKNFNGQQLKVDLQNKFLTSGTYILNVTLGDTKQSFKVLHY